MMVLPRNACRDCQVSVGSQMPDLAVHRHHVAWLDDVVAVEQLPRAGMPGHMDERIPPVHHVSTEPGQAVDHPIDRALVARDHRAGKYDGVTALQLDHRVLPVGHP